jgi:hypothetical protein
MNHTQRKDTIMRHLYATHSLTGETELISMDGADYCNFLVTDAGLQVIKHTDLSETDLAKFALEAARWHRKNNQGN